MTHARSVEKVGYKNPPHATRWKKGQSGNPNRKRKRRPKSIIGLIDEYFAKEIEITIAGISSRATIFEIIVTQLWSKTLAGEKRAMNVLLSYLEFSSADHKDEFVIINQYSESMKKMMAELESQRGVTLEAGE